MNELIDDIIDCENEIDDCLGDLAYALYAHKMLTKQHDFLVYCHTGKFPE